MNWRILTALLPNYEISENGDVRRIGGGLHKGTISKAGYRRFCLRCADRHRRNLFAHRLVCLAFNGPAPDGSDDVAHTDGDKLHNHFSNLRWATRKENEADKRLHGTSPTGERHPNSKLTWDAVRSIRATYHGGPGQMADLARAHGVAIQTVWKILNGENWKEAA